MSLDTLLARGRAAAEALMVDTCVIRRVTSSTTDPDTGEITPTYATVYSGRCRVQQYPTGGAASRVEAGESSLLMLPLVVQVPISVTGVLTGDEVAITASAHDADLVNRVLLVKDLSHKTHGTMRRLGCTERTS